MKIIIDTHIFLWALSEPNKIQTRLLQELESPTNTIYVSSITVVELMIKTSMGKIPVNFDPIEVAQQSGFEMLDFSAQDALALKDMPFHHKDPFDRMLVAQGIARNHTIMTQDLKFSLYECVLV